MIRYNQELTKYARRILTELYAFAVCNSHIESNEILKNQLAELLAFASDDQINEIGKRLNQQPDPTKFIQENYGAWLLSNNNPARFSPQKPQPKTATKISTKRKYF